MPQLIRPQTKIKVVPKDGEIEITLNINITVDGKVIATADNAEVAEIKANSEDKPAYAIPDFLSGLKLNFGKKE